MTGDILTATPHAAKKQDLRCHLLARRSAVPTGARIHRDEAICLSLLSLPAFSEADAVLTYAAVRGEPDLSALTQSLLEHGLAVAYPRALPGGRMTFCRIRSTGELVPGFHGIPEPQADAPEIAVTVHTVCLVPGIAYDLSGYRLGYGGGYYDRFLAGFSGTSVGIVWDKPFETPLPRQKTDRCVDCLVSAVSVFYPRKDPVL